MRCSSDSSTRYIGEGWHGNWLPAEQLCLIEMDADHWNLGASEARHFASGVKAPRSQPSSKLSLDPFSKGDLLTRRLEKFEPIKYQAVLNAFALATFGK